MLHALGDKRLVVAGYEFFGFVPSVRFEVVNEFEALFRVPVGPTITTIEIEANKVAAIFDFSDDTHIGFFLNFTSLYPGG